MRPGVLHEFLRKDERNQPESGASKAVRVAASAGVGGLAGRLMAYNPVHGGPMNRATKIGAAVGAGVQIASNIAGNRVKESKEKGVTKEEYASMVRNTGHGVTGLALVGGAIGADIRNGARSAQYKAEEMGVRMGGEFSTEEAFRQQTTHNRIMRSNTFIPKIGKRAETSDGRSGMRVTVDETGGSKEDKLARLAKRAAGTPEGAAAQRALNKARDASGKTIKGKVMKAGRMVAGAVAGMIKKKVPNSPVRSGLLLR